MTVDKVVRRASVSRGTFYELFSDREDCFLAAYQEAVGHVIALARKACEAGGPPEQRLERGLRAILEFAVSEPQVARMCIAEVLGAGARARKQRAETIAHVTRLVAALADGSDGPAETLARARVLVGGVHEMLYDALARGDVEAIPDIAGQVMSWYRLSAAPPPAAPQGN